jgi:hypothetical protein
MENIISISLNTIYYPNSIALLNSIKYFYPDITIRIYNFERFNHLIKQYLVKMGVEIIDVYDQWLADRSSCDYAFKPYGTCDSFRDENELMIDADMLLLDNIDEIFNLIQNGYFVVSAEFYGKKTMFKDGVESDIFNGGLLGFNKIQHKEILLEWKEKCMLATFRRDVIPPEIYNEQTIISYILKKNNTKIKVLNQKHYMNTWDSHNDKILKLQSGIPCLFNSDMSKIKIYHFTGGIGVETSQGVTSSRFSHANNNNFIFNKFMENMEDCYKLKQGWYNLWKKYNNPVYFICDHFNNLGPFECPKVFNLDFRVKISKLITLFNKTNKKFDMCSKEVLSICMAYDYITLLNYTLIGDGWMNSLLQYLLEENKHDIFISSDKTIGFNMKDADINLSYSSENLEFSCNWFGASKGYVENVKNIEIIDQLYIRRTK